MPSTKKRRVQVGEEECYSSGDEFHTDDEEVPQDERRVPRISERPAVLARVAVVDYKNKDQTRKLCVSNEKAAKKGNYRKYILKNAKKEDYCKTASKYNYYVKVGNDKYAGLDTGDAVANHYMDKFFLDNPKCDICGRKASYLLELRVSKKVGNGKKKEEKLKDNMLLTHVIYATEHCAKNMLGVDQNAKALTIVEKLEKEERKQRQTATRASTGGNNMKPFENKCFLIFCIEAATT